MSKRPTMAGHQRVFRLVTVLDRMIALELFQSLLAVLTVMVTIIVTHKFIRILAQAIEGNIANETVLQLLGLKTIIVTATFLPAAMFMAVLIVLGRMYREHEMAAVASAGGGLFTLYRGLFMVLVPVTLVAMALSMWAAPWEEATIDKLSRQDEQNADVRRMSAGRFSEYSHGELIFYSESVASDGRMTHVFVQHKQGDKAAVSTADNGRLELINGGLYLILENGERWIGVAGQKAFTVETFQEYAVLIEKKPLTVGHSRQATATALLQQSTLLHDIAELQSRINIPLGVVLLAFLAAPLAKLSPRGGVYGSLLTAFGIYFVYSNLQRLNYSWVVSGLMPPWLGYCGLNGLLMLVGVVMVMRFYGWQWLRQQFKTVV